MTALVGLPHPGPSGGSVSSGLGGQHALSGDQRLQTLELLVGGAKCASCLGRIESAVLRLPGMETARLNLTTGKLHVAWRGALAARAVVEAVIGLGYSAAPYDVDKRETDAAREERGLVIAMVVAGLATVGVMFLSEPVWFGEDMDASSIALLRWLAALIAVPASLFSGQSFFASALASIRARRMNMDVPISLAVILALLLSLYATATSGAHAYFDAAVMLLFFLLIGRLLDARLRRRAFAAANALAAMQASSVTRLSPGGVTEVVRAADIRPGDILLVSAGERIAVDAEVLSGASEADLRLVTGEVDPVATFPGQILHSGAINLAAPLRIRALAAADHSLMADVARLLEAGEQKKSGYRRLADKVAAIYVPLVHTTAFVGFVGWIVLGASLTQAAFIAVTVLIITCPCALGLAAPLVQVVAAQKLFGRDIFLSSGDALERLATVDHVVLDKTGTLTLGEPALSPGDWSDEDLQDAAQLARCSRHPLSRAIVAAARSGPVSQGVREHPGLGMEGLVDGRKARLGRSGFVAPGPDRPGLWFSFEGGEPRVFIFDDIIRPDAAQAVARLKALGLEIELLSGDSVGRVEAGAAAAGIDVWTASATPQSKAARLAELESAGRKVLMVGDGLNDAGALAGAHASMAPGGAVDISRLAADCIYATGNLNAVVDTIVISRKARDRMRENFALASAYNLLAIPLALMGWATPVVAAIAMSLSSVAVTLNALRMPR